MYEVYNLYMSTKRQATAEISASQARADFSALVDAAYARQERVVVKRNGRRIAAIVPIEDLEALEALEYADDVRAVRRARREQGRAKPESWESVKKALGLE